MNRHFGATYAESWAKDTFIEELGMTPHQALERGVDTQVVWRAIWAHERLDPREK
jgi:hypothetical protein